MTPGLLDHLFVVLVIGLAFPIGGVLQPRGEDGAPGAAD